MFYFRIMKEIKLLDVFDHMNIVQFVGWSQWSDNIAILMEYLSGGSLHRLMTFNKDRLIDIPYVLIGFDFLLIFVRG